MNTASYVEYFESMASKVLLSNSFDEAKDYLGFYLGALGFVQRFDLFETIEDKNRCDEMLQKLVTFVETYNEN